MGMVVVLAMMVFAAPAMAQSDEITVNTTNESIYNYYAGERNATDLSVTVSGGKEPYRYEWYLGEDIVGYSSTYDFPNGYPGLYKKQAGTYKCVVTDAEGKKGTSQNIIVIINDAPTLTVYGNGKK